MVLDQSDKSVRTHFFAIATYQLQHPSRPWSSTACAVDTRRR